MNDIDFLPIEYREKHAQRQSQPWQAFVAAAIVGLVAVAFLVQHYRRHFVQSDLAVIAPVYNAALEQQNRLADAQKQLEAAKANAELYTYLRHPWPRSQLLTALIEPLPDSITLQEVQILREPAPVAPPAGAPPEAPKAPTDAKAEAERIKELPPAARDLLNLANKLNPMQTTIVLVGTAGEIAPLHRYIGDLDAKEIFEKVELDCINRIDNDKLGGGLHFRAVLTVQPGYGQPGGPVQPVKGTLAQTKR